MNNLQKGDRVTVSIPPRLSYNGVIVGEGRTGEWWLVLKDGRKHALGIAKSFCRPEALPPVSETYATWRALSWLEGG